MDNRFKYYTALKSSISGKQLGNCHEQFKLERRYHLVYLTIITDAEWSSYFPQSLTVELSNLSIIQLLLQL